MNLIFLTPSFGTALCPVMQPSPPFCLSLYSTLALSMNSVFSCVIIVSVQLWNLNCTHLYLLISLAITSVELMKGSLPDTSTWYFVRKRTFHHFMSTSATEKSLHYCLFPRNCAIHVTIFCFHPFLYNAVRNADRLVTFPRRKQKGHHDDDSKVSPPFPCLCTSHLHE